MNKEQRMSDQTRELGEERIGKLLWKYSMPAIVSMLVVAVYSIVDRIFVGHGVGLLAISATTVVMPLGLLVLAFGLMIGVGSSVMLSIKLGQNNLEDAERILGNAMTLTLIVSVFLTALGLFYLEPLLVACGASKEVLPLAKQFGMIATAGVVFQMLGFVFNNIMRSEGNPKTAMVIMVVGTVLNVILNPIFIFLFHWGIRGSAWATFISQLVSGVWLVAHFMGKRSHLKFKLKNFRLDWPLVGRVLSIGVSSFIFQIVTGSVMVIFNQSLKFYGGDTAIAAMGIIGTVSMLIMMPIFGIAQGAQPIIGYNYGAGNLERVRQTLKFAIAAATCISVTGFVLIELFPELMLKAFSHHEKLLEMGSPGMRIFLLMMPIAGFGVLAANYFQSIGKASVSIVLSLAKPLLLQMPLLFLMPGWFHLNGIWLTGPISDLLATSLTGALIAWEIKKYLGGRRSKPVLAHPL